MLRPESLLLAVSGCLLSWLPINPTHGDPIESTSRSVRVQSYDIPLHALQSADCSNLLMAGRCISGDFLAHSSYRVTGNAVAMGEAAGRCPAAWSRQRARSTGLSPHHNVHDQAAMVSR